MILDFRFAIIGLGNADLIPRNSDFVQNFRKYFNTNKARLFQDL